MAVKTGKAKTYKKGDIFYVPPKDIKIKDDFNPAGRCNDVSDIYDSIEENGVIEPTQGYREKGEFWLTSGHRRLHTAKLLKLDFIPFLPKKKVSEGEQLLDIFTHNTGKKLNELQEGELFQKMLDMKDKDDKHIWNQEKIGKKVGRTQAMISQRLKLVNSITSYIKKCINQEIMSAHAALRLNEQHPDEKEQKIIITKVLVKKSKLKGKTITAERAITELKKAGRFKIAATEIPNKPGRQKASTVNRVSKTIKSFEECISYMEKSDDYKPLHIRKVQGISNAIKTSKTPQSLAKMILNAI